MLPPSFEVAHTEVETARLQEAHDKKAPWKKWGPYLVSASGATSARITARAEQVLELAKRLGELVLDNTRVLP